MKDFDRILIQLEIYHKCDGHQIEGALLSEIAYANKIYMKANVQYDYITRYNDYSYEEFAFFNKNAIINECFPICDFSKMSNEAKEMFENNKVKTLKDKAIKIYYFDILRNKMGDNDITKGFSIPLFLTNIEGLKNSIFLSKNRSNYTVMHELSHILFGTLHNPQYIVPSNNIFASPASGNSTNFIDSNMYKNDERYHPCCRCNQIELIYKNIRKFNLLKERGE